MPSAHRPGPILLLPDCFNVRAERCCRIGVNPFVRKLRDYPWYKRCGGLSTDPRELAGCAPCADDDLGDRSKPRTIFDLCRRRYKRINGGGAAPNKFISNGTLDRVEAWDTSVLTTTNDGNEFFWIEKIIGMTRHSPASWLRSVGPVTTHQEASENE